MSTAAPSSNVVIASYDFAGNPAHLAYVQALNAWRLADFPTTDYWIRQALQSSPQEPSYWNLLGAALYRQGELLESANAYRKAVTLNPNFSEGFSNLCLVLCDQGDLREAEQVGRRAVQLNPTNADAFCNLGNVFAKQARILEAKQLYSESLRLSPNNLNAKRNLGHVFKELGQFEEAQRLYKEVLRQNPRDGQAYEQLAQIRRHTAADQPHCSALEAVLMDPQLPVGDRISMHFAVGKMYEDMKDYEQSFGHYQRANSRISSDFDLQTHKQFIDRLIAYFTPERLASLQNAGDPSRRPVFIVGMFRSGTSLVEQILASHPDVYGCGERMDIPQWIADLPARTEGRSYPDSLDALTDDDLRQFATEYLEHRRSETGGAAQIIDKMPKNFLTLGLIALLFPNARVIHCRRDPRDTCVSCYAANFAARPAYASNLGHLGDFYRQYERLMAHWRQVLPLPILDVDYESVVGDQVGATQRMLSFLELPWNEKCLSFHTTQRPVNTASDWQVRQPLYHSSVGRWRNFESHLGPLFEALDRRG